MLDYYNDIFEHVNDLEAILDDLISASALDSAPNIGHTKNVNVLEVILDNLIGASAPDFVSNV